MTEPERPHRPRDVAPGGQESGAPGASEDALLARWLVPNPEGGGPAVWRVTELGPEVWALTGYLAALADADPADPAGRAALLAQAARDFGLPREAVEAALVFYRRHRAAIDAVAEAKHPTPIEPAPPAPRANGAPP